MPQTDKTNNLEWVDRSRQSIAFLDEENLLQRIRSIVREEVVNAAQNEKLDKFYTIKQTCEMLNISESTFHRWKKNGTLKVIGKGSVIRVSEQEIQRMLLNATR